MVPKVAPENPNCHLRPFLKWPQRPSSGESSPLVISQPSQSLIAALPSLLITFPAYTITYFYGGYFFLSFLLVYSLSSFKGRAYTYLCTLNLSNVSERVVCLTTFVELG